MLTSPGCRAAPAASAATPQAHTPLRRPRPPLLSPPPPPRGPARWAPRGVVTCSTGASGARTRAAAPPGFGPGPPRAAAGRRTPGVPSCAFLAWRVPDSSPPRRCPGTGSRPQGRAWDGSLPSSPLQGRARGVAERVRSEVPVMGSQGSSQGQERRSTGHLPKGSKSSPWYLREPDTNGSDLDSRRSFILRSPNSEKRHWDS